MPAWSFYDQFQARICVFNKEENSQEFLGKIPGTLNNWYFKEEIRGIGVWWYQRAENWQNLQNSENLQNFSPEPDSFMLLLTQYQVEQEWIT